MLSVIRHMLPNGMYPAGQYRALWVSDVEPGIYSNMVVVSPGPRPRQRSQLCVWRSSCARARAGVIRCLCDCTDISTVRKHLSKRTRGFAHDDGSAGRDIYKSEVAVAARILWFHVAGYGADKRRRSIDRASAWSMVRDASVGRAGNSAGCSDLRLPAAGLAASR